MASMLHIAKRRIMPALSAMITVLFTLCISAVSLYAQTPTQSGPERREGERRGDIFGADSARFQMMPFADQPKVYKQTYSHTELIDVPPPVKSLFTQAELDTNYCSDRAIKRLEFYLRLSMGNIDYEMDTVNFDITVILKATLFSGGIQQGGPYKDTLHINSISGLVKPEQWLTKDLTSKYSTFDEIRITITGYTFASSDPSATVKNTLKSNVVLDAWFTEEFTTEGVNSGDVESPMVMIGTLPVVSKRVVANPVTFQWSIVGDCGHDVFPNYQVQVLRLFNRSEDPAHVASEETILDTLDWSRALTVETGNSDTSITLTLAEGTGYYVWRVRPIGNKYPGGIANDRNWGAWSVAPPNGPLDVADIDESNVTAGYKPSLFFYSAGDRDRNWMYSRRFSEGAEGTRISEGMDYATGLLQSRQTQAHMQSQDRALVVQTVSDYNGRPSLTTLPAPIAWGGFNYKAGFVKAGPSTSATLYTAADFDDDTMSTDPSPVSSVSIPASYYSDQNSDLQVPNAANYPFTRVRYYPDASGRVAEQGGAGEVFRIGGGAEGLDRTMRTYYGQASDTELVAMFGDEAPSDTTVQKIITVDPNKVASIKYVSKEGQTLATALVKQALPAGTHLTELTETTIFDALVAKRVGPNRPGREFGAEASTTVTIMEADSLRLHYSITPATLESACTEVCSTCDYIVDLMVIPAEDPGTTVFHKIYTIPAGACSEDGSLDVYIHTDILPPGSYTIVKRIHSGGDNADSLPVREALAREEVSSIRSDIETTLTGVRAYLNTANLKGLYSYLDTLHTLGQASYDSENRIYTLATSCCTMTIPVVDCDPSNPCGSSIRDFEGYLFQKWGPGNYAYGGNPDKNFGSNLDKYFYDYFPWQPLYGVNEDRFPGHKGQFNAMIGHMIDSGYVCDSLWSAWRELVDGFGYVATSHHLGDPDDLTFGYNLLDQFLRKVGRAYVGVSTCQYGDCGTVDIEGDGDHSGFGMGYFEYAFTYFRYTSDNTETENCRVAMGWVDGGGSPKNLIVKDDGAHTSHLDAGLSWTQDQWTNFHDCLFAPKPGTLPKLPVGCEDPTGEECIIAMRDALVDTCQTYCERKRPAFTASVIAAYHTAGEVVVGDTVTPDGERVDALGYVYDDESVVIDTVAIVPQRVIDCQVQVLVEHCQEDCGLSLVRDTSGKVTWFGTESENILFPKALAYSWRVAIPVGGVCPDSLQSLSSAHSNSAYAWTVVAHLNNKMRDLRLAGGDSLTADSLSRYFHAEYAAYTGRGGCDWHLDTTSHNSDSGECCPPVGLPKIFTLGPKIVAAYFTLDSCSLVYVRVCKVDTNYITQREVLCGDICLDSCSSPICFAWVPMFSAETTAVIRPYTCPELKCAAITRSLDEQILSCVDAHRADMLSLYRAKCGDPAELDDDLTVQYKVSAYHFTLYYYDRAGRVVRTVPPRGVSLNATNRATHPTHTLYTSYDYNSLGQIVRQRTPDANASRVFYDAKGRARFMQTAEQSLRNAFSYSKYDELGRVIESGEGKFVNPTDLTTQLDSMNYPPVAVTSESYKTVYTASAGVSYEPGTARAASQRYLRNRVSYTASTRAGASATYYSYDAHGNVEWIVQDIQGLGQNYIRYEYDLVSNKVLGLYYNEGLGEHLAQRYSYDEDNRVVKVESSRNGVIWDRDASYTYYLHGPVRRAEYGEDSIQGVDYTHTLEGWLKGINHPSLSTSVDPGLDGDASAGVHPKYGADGFGMTLTYYEGDFLRKSGTTQSAFNSSSPTGYSMRGDHLPGDSDLVRAGHLNLYNGNITAWSSQGKNVPGGLSGEQYAYDRLNRLLWSTFTRYNADSSKYLGNGDYNTSYTYDPSGNILTLNRNQDVASGRRPMDSLTYWYPATQNRLLYVDDKVAAGVPGNDIDDQAPGNYAYDASGRLIYDRQEGINAIDWSPTNKPLAVRKAGTIIRFFYDAQGNRIKKESDGTTTYYVYEAGGKLLATYTQPCVPGADMAGGGDEGCLSPSGPSDVDHDGIPDSVDNASLFFNPDQHDGDGDGVSDPIDTDDDNDGISDFTDPCPFDALNSCVGDRDSDGIPDGIDGCANVPGNGGGDKDGDGKPDGCDQDLDGDGVPNHEDNCPWTYNPDQADADTNGIGDVCQCPAETTGGTCPITLAEQFVYGSAADGRVVTVFRDTVRDMSDHSEVDSIFTRRLRQKEYELADHLGNVRVRVSDLKRTSTPGSAPYTVDERGYQEYYPFGMLEPNRGATLQGLTPRFGYNGKEYDNDVNNRNGAAGQNGGGNSYDYGYRMYNPRLGRFLSEDPLAPEYPWYTPYQFAGNTPIMATDLDGLEPVIRQYVDRYGNVRNSYLTITIKVVNNSMFFGGSSFNKGFQNMVEKIRSDFSETFHYGGSRSTGGYSSLLGRNLAFSSELNVEYADKKDIDVNRDNYIEFVNDVNISTDPGFDAVGVTGRIGYVPINHIEVQMAEYEGKVAHMRNIDRISEVTLHELGHYLSLRHPNSSGNPENIKKSIGTNNLMQNVPRGTDLSNEQLESIMRSEIPKIIIPADRIDTRVGSPQIDNTGTVTNTHSLPR